MTKLVLAALVAFLVYVVVSYVFYEVVMGDQFAAWESEVARAEPLIWPGVLALGVLMLTMSAVLPYTRRRDAPWLEGARLGLVFGVTASCLFLFTYAVYELALAGTITDIVFNLVLFTIAGAIIGLVHGETAGA